MVDNPLQCFRVHIENTHQEVINFDSGVQLYQDTWLEHQDKATLKGTVTYAPASNSMGVSKGDTLIFRYDVVADSDFYEGTSQRKYHNMLMMPGGKPEWVVSPEMAIAKVAGNQLHIADDLVMGTAEVIEKPKSSIIFLPEQYQNEKTHDIINVTFAGKNTGLQPGDKVLVIKKYLQHYNIDSIYGKEVVVVKKNYVIAKIDQGHDN